LLPVFFHAFLHVFLRAFLHAFLHALMQEKKPKRKSSICRPPTRAAILRHRDPSSLVTNRPSRNPAMAPLGRRRATRLLLPLLFALTSIASGPAPIVVAQTADGSVLPFPPTPTASVAGETIQSSKLTWR
jgi:hypothetical protein